MANDTTEIMTPDPSDPDVAIIKTEEKYKPTAEIPFLFLFFSITMTGNVTKNLLLYRTCIHTLGYNTTLCSELQLNNRSDFVENIEKEIQPYVTILSMTATVLQGIVPAILSLFLGAWSDTHGRKPLMVWPLFGVTISSFATVIFALEENLGSWWYLLTIIPASFAGGACSLFTGALCYITDITSEKNRSFRLAMLEGALLMGMIFGSIASPYAFDKLGYVYTFLLGTVINALAYMYTSIFIKESIPNPVPGGLSTLFKLYLIKDMLRTCFKKRPNYNRAIIFLLILASSLIIFNMYGLLDNDYLYTRLKVKWELAQYSLYSATNTVIVVTGLLVGSWLLQKLTGVSDMIIVLVGFISLITHNLLIAFANMGWQFYAAGGIAFLRGTGAPLIRSQLSKMVPVEDIAKIYAFLSGLQAIVPLFSPILFNSVYTLTLSTFPGAIYIMAASFHGVCLISTGAAFYLLRRFPPVLYSLMD